MRFPPFPGPSFFTIRQGPSVGPSTELHTSAPYPGIAAGAADAVLELSAPCTLAGDIKVQFVHHAVPVLCPCCARAVPVL